MKLGSIQGVKHSETWFEFKGVKYRQGGVQHAESAHHQHHEYGGHKIRDAVLADASVNLGEALPPEPHDADGDKGEQYEGAHRPSDFPADLGDIQRPRIEFERGVALLENFPNHPENTGGDDEIPEHLPTGWRGLCEFMTRLWSR